MKTPALLLGVLLATSSVALTAAPKASMLLAGESHRSLNDLTLIAKGNAYAIVGDFRVAAEEITFDPQNHRLSARGVSSISSGYAQPGAKEVTVTVDVENVYRLNPSGIIINGTPTASPDETTFRGNVFTRAHRDVLPAAPVVAATTSFSKTLPKLQLDLSQRPGVPAR